MFATILHTVPYILGAALCLFVMWGFWRGLALPPHKEGHGPRQTINWWWYRPRD